MEPPFQVKKVSDEGSSSPFMARIFISTLEFRDFLLSAQFSDQELFNARGEFDNKFRPCLRLLRLLEMQHVRFSH